VEDSKKIKRVEIIVYGIVQGVFFRANTRDVAVKLGLRGTVRNLHDGSVEIIAEGYQEDLNALISFAKRGPPSAKVYDINIVWKDPQEDLPFFKITY
jgi:acylphosphatase